MFKFNINHTGHELRLPLAFQVLGLKAYAKKFLKEEYINKNKIKKEKEDDRLEVKCVSST